jgi:hypothetical protein
MRLFWIASLAFAGSGCGSDPLVCTDELVAVPVAVANRTGQASASLTVRDSVLRTGMILDITAEHPAGSLPANGVSAVIVFSDAFQDAVLPAGEPVAVTVTAGNRSARVVFEFGTDGCHVQKLAGPDTLELE